MRNHQQDKKERSILKIFEKTIKKLQNLKEKKEKNNYKSNKRRKDSNYLKLTKLQKQSKIKLQEQYNCITNLARKT